MHLAVRELEAVVDTRASASIVAEGLAYELGIWKSARKVKVKQQDESTFRKYFVVNALFKTMDCTSVLCKFTMDVKVLDIDNRDVILGLCWLTENTFSVDTQDRYLRNVNTG